MAPQHRVEPGDWVTIDYTCQTPDGKLAATSRKEAATDKNIYKSAHYVLYDTYLPANLQASTPQHQGPVVTAKMSFEEMLELLLCQQAVGKPFNSSQTLTVEGELIPNISGGDRYLGMNRSYTIKRKSIIPASTFKQKYNVPPEVGKELNGQTPDFSVTVEGINGDQVTLCFNAKPGAAFSTPFGSGIITQTADDFVITTNAIPGTIIRSGGMIGMITDVTDTTFQVDYGHSSGFTPLTCDVIIKPFTSPDGLVWLHDLDAAKEESLKSGKPLMVHFHDQWSTPNRKFISEVMPVCRVKAAAENYVRVRVSASDSLAIFREYGVTTIPTVIIYDSNGKEIRRLSGLPTTEEFASELEQLMGKAE
jgi:FKBP-type peptidyl-prolyl cis-trans isomerase 2